MKRSRVFKKCLICDKLFEVIKSREKTAKTCSRYCYHRYSKSFTPWNKNKSYEEIYSAEELIRIKRIQSNHSCGSNNPMYGKTHTKKIKRLLSKLKKNNIPWNKGKRFPGIFSSIDRTGSNNAIIKYILKKENITFDEYLTITKDRKSYRRAVLNITKSQPIHLLKNYDKRGNKSYHLDHIYPISKGFENKVPPLVIGDISNLKFIHWTKNLQKSNKLSESTKKKYENSVSI